MSEDVPMAALLVVQSVTKKISATQKIKCNLCNYAFHKNRTFHYYSDKVLTFNYVEMFYFWIYIC